MKTYNIRIDSSTIIRAILFVLLALLLYEIFNVVLVALTAVVLASAVEPGVKQLTRYRVPRVLAVTVVYLFALSAVFAFAYFFLPTVIANISELFARAPEYIRSLQLDAPGLTNAFGGTAGEPLSVSEVVSNLQNTSVTSFEELLGVVSSVFGGVVSFFLIITLSFYLAVKKNGVENFLRLVVPVAREEYVIDLWKRTQVKIGKWLQGQIVLMVIVGVLSYLGLVILGVPNAGLLAMIAGLFEIIPVFGPILSAVPAIALAALSGGLTLALLTAGLFAIVQQFENNLIHPLVVTKVVGVSPIIVILAIFIGGQLAGFLGVLLAVPLAAGIVEFADDVREKKRATKTS